MTESLMDLPRSAKDVSSAELGASDPHRPSLMGAAAALQMSKKAAMFRTVEPKSRLSSHFENADSFSLDSSVALDEEDDSEEDSTPLKKGRRRIQIAPIVEKSKRQVTFSKRKTGLFKKAFEICELTGSQVLLVLASETGNVYTYATPHLRAIVDQPEGQALINACLGRKEERLLSADQKQTPSSSSSSLSSSSSSASSSSSKPTIKQEFSTAPLPSDTRTEQIFTRSRVAKNKLSSNESTPKNTKRQKVDTNIATTTTAAAATATAAAAAAAVVTETTTSNIIVKEEINTAASNTFAYFDSRKSFDSDLSSMCLSNGNSSAEFKTVSTPPPSLTPTTTDDESFFSAGIKPKSELENNEDDNILVGSPYSWDEILGPFPNDESSS